MWPLVSAVEQYKLKFSPNIISLSVAQIEREPTSWRKIIKILIKVIKKKIIRGILEEKKKIIGIKHFDFFFEIYSIFLKNRINFQNV